MYTFEDKSVSIKNQFVWCAICDFSTLRDSENPNKCPICYKIKIKLQRPKDLKKHSDKNSITK